VEEAIRQVEGSTDETRRARVREICRRHFAARKLPMRFVDVDFDAGGRSATVYFFSEEKVDFRELFPDLSRDLRLRVTLHRLGPRDEAKRSGTCGPCGRMLCCRTFLAAFPAVSVRMVKAQKFPLTPDRSSGMCGRLKCCLAYEAGIGPPQGAGCLDCCLPALEPGRVQVGSATSES
jgi:cell fate regulator YaaT (PSP1 superfamily)